MNFKQLAQTIATAATLLIAQPIHAETFYFHNDHLGTPQALTDDSGTVVWQGNYSPFGEVTETTDTVEQNIRFPGQYFEEETGLHYNYFRDYDPGTGRYIESDPIGLDGGINTFGYVGGRPISHIDPTGELALIGLWPFVAGGGAASGTAAGGAAASGFWGFVGTGVVVGAVASMSGDSDKAEKARERKAYSRVCKTAVRPSGNPCTDATNNLNRLKRCLQMRKDFSRKWYNDSDPGHMGEIQGTQTAIKKLTDWIRDNCGGKCG